MLPLTPIPRLLASRRAEYKETLVPRKQPVVDSRQELHFFTTVCLTTRVSDTDETPRKAAHAFPRPLEPRVRHSGNSSEIPSFEVVHSKIYAVLRPNFHQCGLNLGVGEPGEIHSVVQTQTILVVKCPNDWSG